MMIATGGVAFPDQCQSGMTLRDYFAAQALAGAGTWMPSTGSGNLSSESAITLRASWAYRQADAMLAERNKQ